MASEEEIYSLLRRLTKRPPVLFVAEVLSVDETAKTVTVQPLHEDIELPDVRLKGALDDKPDQWVVVPKVGSTVLVGLLGNSNDMGFVAMVNEPAKVFGKIGETSLELTAEGITMNGGNQGGMTITPKLVEELNKTNELLSALMAVLSGTPIPEPGNGSASALQTALGTALKGKQLGNFEQVENQKVKQ